MTIYEEIIEGLKAASNGSDTISLSAAIDVVNEKHKQHTSFLSSQINDVIAKMDENNLIDGRINRDVYEHFVRLWCDGPAPNIIHVSQCITKNFNYKIIDKKINGRKYRLFIKI